MKLQHILSVIALALLLSLPSRVFAVACTTPLSGSTSIASDCSFSGTINGVDSGTGSTNTAVLTLTSGILTVTANQQIGFGRLVLSGGVLALPDNGSASLNVGSAIWMPDADSDNYPESTTQTVSSSSPGAGYRRRSALTSATSADCYSSANAYPGQTAYFTTHRGDGSFDYDCDGIETKQRNVCTCQGCGAGCPAAPSCVLSADTGGTFSACGVSQNAGPASCTRTNDGYGVCTACTNTGTTMATVQCR